MTFYIREAKTSNYFRAIGELHKSNRGHLYISMETFPISKTTYYSKPKNKRVTISSSAVCNHRISEIDNRAVLYYLLDMEI